MLPAAEVNPGGPLAKWIRKRRTSKSSEKDIGISVRDLRVHGHVTAANYLQTCANAPIHAFSLLGKLFRNMADPTTEILREIDFLAKPRDMVVVLGRPGSGCTTLLKVIAGEFAGLSLGPESRVNYDGLLPSDMHGEFRGDCIFTGEVDVHFPELTVGETLGFAAAAKSDNRHPEDVCETRDVMVDTLHLTPATSTKVGNELIRGISGGEKKRLSIAEALMSMASIQCWDHSTRGMDSETALQIIRHFKTIAREHRSTIFVTLYQASQRALEAFDKVLVLYNGRQIFFGTWSMGSDYFQSLGFERPRQMTIGYFFTALTNPEEARQLVRAGMESQVPITAEDFATEWRVSAQRHQLMLDISKFDKECLSRPEKMAQVRIKNLNRRKSFSSSRSPYQLPVVRQVRLCLRRGFKRVENNIALPISTVVGNACLGVIVGSVFYNLDNSSESMSSRTILLFFATLLNGFMSGFEVMAVWNQRPIVEKHSRYTFYHPFTEAISAMVCDIPAKLLASIFFNLPLYFMTNLRQSPASFFAYWLFCVICLMTMSMFFRCIGSLSRTLQQAMVPIGVCLILFIIYTGFVIPQRDMHPWLSWIRYLDPVAYAFESLMIIEFRGRRFPCVNLMPSGPDYEALASDQKICANVGSFPGDAFIDGNVYLSTVFNYHVSHLWRNLGILLAMMVVLCAAHVVSSEFILAQKPKGEVLLYLRRKHPFPHFKNDEESLGVHSSASISNGEKSTSTPIPAKLGKQASTFCWSQLCYDITVDGKPKRLMSNIDGWVKPGTLTALMGATGAGKTTLLDVLSQRTSIGAVSGSILVDGLQRGSDFQRNSGYAQQQDVHLSTATVREALNFSASMRQPSHIPKREKLAYVDEVITVLQMEDFADAIVGIPGQGLNVGQRKRLTLGIELAAKPELLLFLDEPTSGLDSQTAWMICTLLRKLADNGLAILCTIHQPSSLLLQMFDRLLLIEKGGSTVYFGDVGPDCRTVTSYLEGKGARACRSEENAAEWMMEVISSDSTNWNEMWQNSTEKTSVALEIAKLTMHDNTLDSDAAVPERRGEFALPLFEQVVHVTQRTFVEYWRTPPFLYAKFLFTCGASLAIAFSCWQSPNTLQGLQTQIFALFVFFTILSNLMQQIVAQFISRRSLFEAREGPSKTFSWKAFLLSAAITEGACQVILSLFAFFLFYYPMGMYMNADPGERAERGTLMFLYFVAFFLFTSTFSHLVTVGMEHQETIVNIGSLLFYLILIFCGILVTYDALPRFWVFMYWISPLTYLIGGMFATGVANQPITCSSIELLRIPSQGGMTCSKYLSPFVSFVGGTLVNPESTGLCEFCPLTDTNALLRLFKIDYDARWRDLGVVFAFILFNVAATFLVYWLVRVPRRQRLVGQGAD